MRPSSRIRRSFEIACSSRRLPALAVALLFLLGPVAPAAAQSFTHDLYMNASADPDQTWSDEVLAYGDPSCGPCDCSSGGTFAYEEAGPNYGYLWAEATGPNLVLPAGHRITSVVVNTMCRYNDGQSGTMRMKVRFNGNEGDEHGPYSSPSFTSGQTCEWRLSGAGDITSLRSSWTASDVNNLWVGTRRWSTTGTDGRFRVKAIRIRVTYIADWDGDGIDNASDPDDDNDGVNDPQDPNDFNNFICGNITGDDNCDDCSVAGFFSPGNDGPDNDADGICNASDPDDDNDGVNDPQDPNDNNPFICGDSDGDGCDDCAVAGTFAPGNDGPDCDGDGLCNSGDPDDDNDGVNDPQDPNDCNNFICGDSDGDGCDDCAVAGTFSPGNDGPDWDGDGLCNTGDPDDDNDGVNDPQDPNDNNVFICGDSDGDGCDDCGVAGHFAPLNDGDDHDDDGLCDTGDPDDDNDGCLDAVDPEPFGEPGCEDCDEDCVCNATDPESCPDCNCNDVSDLDEIAADPSLDCDGNLVIDSCEYGTPVDPCAYLNNGAVWIGSDGGTFDDPLNWCPVPVTPGTRIHFNRPDPSHVVATGTPIVASTSVRQGFVRIELAGAATTLDLGNTLEIGGPNDDPVLLLDGGEDAKADFVEVGRVSEPDRQATLRIAGSGTRLKDVTTMNIGSPGTGVLELETGGWVIASGDVVVGPVLGSHGLIRIGDGGSRLTAGNNVVVRRGAVRLEGGTLRALDQVELFPGGRLTGEGTVDAEVENLGGLIAPGLTAPGVLEMQGELKQPAATTSGLAGQVEIDLAGDAPGTGFDRILADGAELSGGLLVRIAEGYAPPLGMRSIIETFTGVTGAFDVLYATGLPDGLGVRAVAPGAAGSTELLLEVLAIGEGAGFLDPESETVIGVPLDVVAVDFDGDGFVDLAAAFPDQGLLAIYRNNGTSGSTWLGFDIAGAQFVNLGGAPSALVAGDWDGVNGIDLAVVNPTLDVVHVLPNDGTGLFPGGAIQPIAVAGAPRGIDAGEVSGDGSMDLVVVTEGTGQLRVLANDGGGTFSLLPSGLPVGIGPRAVRLADFDGDGLLDAVTANAGDDMGSATILQGTANPGGPFLLQDTLTTGLVPIRIDPVDLTGNKRIDIVMANQEGGSLSIIRNIGDAPGTFAFAATVNLDLEGEPQSFDAVDLDADKDFDLAIVVRTGDEGFGFENVIRTIRNDTVGGALALALEAEILGQGESPQIVLGADVDGDDDVDLLSLGQIGGLAPGGSGTLDVRLSSDCPTDLDGDGAIGFTDLVQLLSAWGACSPSCPADFDGDGIVGFADLVQILSSWGACDA